MATGQLKKEKEKISQSLKRREDLTAQMDENLYIEERIKDLCLERNSDEAHVAIKGLLEKNSNLQEEVRKLKREQEIQSVIMCEVMEQKDKAKEEIEEKENYIQQLSLQQEYFIDQLNDTNQ